MNNADKKVSYWKENLKKNYHDERKKELVYR